MAYGDTAGVDEARLDAILALLTGAQALTDLNAALARGSLLPAALVTSSMFTIGDPETLPSVTVAPVLFAVTGGGKADVVDAEDSIRYVGDQSVSRRRQTWHTQVRCYVHPHLFPVAATDTWALIKTQATNRERCLSRMLDWLRADIFCTNAGTDVTLASNEQGLGADTLTSGVVREIRKMWFDKGYEGGTLVFGAAVLLQHILN